MIFFVWGICHKDINIKICLAIRTISESLRINFGVPVPFNFMGICHQQLLKSFENTNLFKHSKFDQYAYNKYSQIQRHTK